MKGKSEGGFMGGWSGVPTAGRTKTGQGAFAPAGKVKKMGKKGKSKKGK